MGDTHGVEHIRSHSVDYENGGYSYQNNKTVTDSYVNETHHAYSDVGQHVVFDQQAKEPSSGSEDYEPMNRDYDEHNDNFDQQYDEQESYGDADQYEAHGEDDYN